MRGEGTPPAVNSSGEGLVRIAGGSVFRGYFFAENFPEVCHPLDDKRDWGDGAGSGGAGEERAFVTEDLGRFDERGHLYILGRRDAVIITGGKKVQPADVESALRASGEFADVAVIGVPDAEWGEVVVACYPAGGRAPDLARAAAGLVGAMKPKRFVAIAEWPRNAQGKINRVELRRIATAGGARAMVPHAKVAEGAKASRVESKRSVLCDLGVRPSGSWLNENRGRLGRGGRIRGAARSGGRGRGSRSRRFGRCQ